MPALNWDTFAELPGSPEKNFEMLCRGAIRLNFGSYGVIRALANQPGVEFHLQVDRPCSLLGAPGRWWGWQCKWYDLGTRGALGATRRKDIEDGIRKTGAHVPGVTDWVLWTRRPLARADQAWFANIRSGMTLHCWTGDDIDNLLSGEAAILRSTYFGELVLTPEMLRDRHQQSVAPIRLRWQPEVHHTTSVERELRRMLGEYSSWHAVRSLAEELRSQIHAVDRAPPVPAPLAPLVVSVVTVAGRITDILVRVANRIHDGDLDLLRDELTGLLQALTPEVTTVPRRLRAGNHMVGLHITNIVASCREALRLLSDVEDAFGSHLVAVLAPAGCGKTQLAAQVTAGTGARSHGVLLHGCNLHANHILDDLARRISIAAHPVPNFESLLAAVDAAGQRARRRLPLVIDGLNESEDPRTWRPLLAELESILAKYPYVLGVCTLRPEFKTEALPQDTRCLAMEGYGDETIEAIRAHFRYYKISVTDALIPIGLLKHPLTLRLFCEVTNPTRESVVDVTTMPGSLIALFDRYLGQVGDRIAELAPRAQRYFAHDVRMALDVIGDSLWKNRTRSIDSGELRRALGDEQRPWDQSLVRALEQEGVLLRMPSDHGGAYVPVYDRLGGHIIASALLARYGQSGFESWIQEASTVALLAGNPEQGHPLANDIVYALVGQVPRWLRCKQLWQLVEEPVRSQALRFAAGLEPAYLDAATVEALLTLVRSGDAELLERLREVRGIASHPLNSEALDSVLRSMGVAERDLRWTEWIRRHYEEFRRDLDYLEQGWREGKMHPSDRLRARWVMWTLTSTIRRLRDQATRALYWFGRSDPEGLFNLTIDSLGVNDVYVCERMLAASYGVVMSHQLADADFMGPLSAFLSQLGSALVGFSATAPTTHYLARLYVRGIVAFGASFYSSAVPNCLRGAWTFATPPPFQTIPEEDARSSEVDGTLQIDFRNYTLGRLFDDRQNYDMNHEDHRAAVVYVRSVVWSLGWRIVPFEAVDRNIAGDRTFSREGRGHRPAAERYGKKYGWIGFFIYAGHLETQGRLPNATRRLSDVDIDPSFPERPPMDGKPVVPHKWLAPNVASDKDWICKSSTEVPRGVIVRERIGEHQGPWVAVHGFIKATDLVIGRQVWAFVSALLAPTENVADIVAALNAGERPWVAGDLPKDYYTFASEIPWHPNFAAEVIADSSPADAYREDIRLANISATIEALSHEYAWENYHSEMNQAGGTYVPSHCFSARFDLRSIAQSFDQCLPNGMRASITLSGVDGLEGDVLYLREDLLREYAGNRAVVCCAFGERTLRHYRSAPPDWLAAAERKGANAWSSAQIFEYGRLDGS